MKVKKESEKVGLKLNIQKTKIMASGPITSWQINGETVETGRFYFFGLQNHCWWCLQPRYKKTFTPWKKSCDQPRQHIKKQRYFFANQSLSSQGYGFSSSHVWMWEFDYKESWVPKNWCFWTVVLKKTLESPLDCRRSKQSILKEISPEYSLEGLMLKLQYFGYLKWRADSFEKTLMLGKLKKEFSSVHLLSRFRLPATPWTAARQASLSISNSWSSLKLMSTESFMPSNYHVWMWEFDNKETWVPTNWCFLSLFIL